MRGRPASPRHRQARRNSPRSQSAEPTGSRTARERDHRPGSPFGTRADQVHSACPIGGRARSPRRPPVSADTRASRPQPATRQRRRPNRLTHSPGLSPAPPGTAAPSRGRSTFSGARCVAPAATAPTRPRQRRPDARARVSVRGGAYGQRPFTGTRGPGRGAAAAGPDTRGDRPLMRAAANHSTPTAGRLARRRWRTLREIPRRAHAGANFGRGRASPALTRVGRKTPRQASSDCTGDKGARVATYTQETPQPQREERAR